MLTYFELDIKFGPNELISRPGSTDLCWIVGIESKSTCLLL